MSRVFAYCRVSTLEQNTENQRREIEAAGFTVNRIHMGWEKFNNVFLQYIEDSYG